MRQRPLAITALGWLYIAVGVAGVVVHGRESLRSFHRADVWIILVELLAVIAGAFMLRGANWARWLALLWIAAHVVIGYLNGLQQAVFHVIIFAGITVLLFRADARAWFRHRPATGN
jgi:hypothetical protein